MTGAADWRPIASAPKDGTRVDLWTIRHSSSGKSYDCRRAPDCYWDARRERWRSRWRTGDGYPAVEKHYVATHWMPLPNPPEQSS